MAKSKAKPRPPQSGPPDLSEQLRRAILDRGISRYKLGQAAQVDPGQIKRFIDGERDLYLATAGRLATALRLFLTERSGKVGRPSTKAARPLEDDGE